MVRARPHVALVALGFPPSGGSGTYRGLAIANHLRRRGWDVTVVTVAEDYLDLVTRSRDDSLVDLVDPGVDVVRVPMRQQHLLDDIRDWGPLRGRFRRLHDDLWHVVTSHAFPERYAGWISPLVRALVRVHLGRRVDVVLASGNPWSTFAAAWAFGRLTGVPYVMDFRDAWTLDMFQDRPAYPAGHLANRWESRLVHAAARVVHVNDPIAQWYAERYPDRADRMVVVRNGYDQEVLPSSTAARGERHPGPTRFGFVGTVTDQQPHEALWGGWDLARRGDLGDAVFEVHGRLGYFARSAARIQALMPIGRLGVSYRGPVPKSEIAAVYDALDVLVVPVPGGRYITSGKVFECLASGLPVVLVCHPESDAVRVSQGHPLVHAVRELSPNGVRDALVEAARQLDDIDDSLVSAAREQAERFERGRQVDVLDVELREVVSGG